VPLSLKPQENRHYADTPCGGIIRKQVQRVCSHRLNFQTPDPCAVLTLDLMLRRRKRNGPKRAKKPVCFVQKGLKRGIFNGYNS
jgi:hypothetical protein